MTEIQLERLAAEGAIPPRNVAHRRASPSGEVSPHPRPDEVVTFRIFYARGLGHPTHPFLLGLLEGWKIGLHHLNPTGMLHIAGFVTVCKAFLVKQEASCQAMEKALDGNFPRLPSF